MESTVLNQLPQPLLEWYDKNRRILPWREEPRPYWVWLSEIMLQQTRVEAALPYFHRFLETLPTIEDLANASEETLLKLWEGLGYYSRVRNLQKAARILCRDWDGQLPADYDAIRALPGIGDYTAGAICSIAFGLPTPAVDGNVLRVVSRITACGGDLTSQRAKNQVRNILAGLYPADRAGDFTQALMELGAVVCLPNGAPLCESCPAAGFCRAKGQGDPLAYPVKPPKKPRRVENRRVWVVISPEGMLLHRRPEKGLLAGIWELPNTLEEEAFPLALPAGEAHPLGKAKHIFSHIEWHMEGQALILSRSFPLPDGWRWATAQELHGQIALPSAFRHYREQLDQLLPRSCTPQVR